MPGKTRRVLVNAAIYGGTQIITWTLSWVLLVVLPRKLGDEKFGKLFFAFSYCTIFGTFVHLGVHAFLVRQVAVFHNPDEKRPGDGHRTAKLRHLIGNVVALRIVLGVVVYALIALTISLLGYDPLTVKAVLIIALTVCVGNIAVAFDDVFEGTESMLAPNVGKIVEKTVTTSACVVLLVVYDCSLIAVCWVYVGSYMVHMLLMLVWLQKRIRFRPRWHTPTIRRIIVGGLPFLMWVLFGEIYVRVDVVMLSLMTSDAVVGWYGAASRIYTTLLFVPSILNTVVFPPLARMGANESDAKSFARATQRLMNMLLFVALPVGAGTIAVANPIVSLLYGGGPFAQSAPALKIFGFSIVLVCIDIMLGTVLIARGKERLWARMAVVAAVFNPAMNAWLIPLTDRLYGNGGIGAAIATALTEALMMGGALYLMPKGVFTRGNVVVFLKGALVCALMVVGLAHLQLTNIVVIIATGAVFYLVTALVVGVLPREDIHHVLHAFRRRG